MGRMYSLLMNSGTITAAQDLVRLSAPSDAVVIVHEVHVTQDTDAGDAESEQMVLQLQRSSSDGTGTAAVPETLVAGDAAFGGTSVIDLSADTTLSGVPLHREAVHVQAGFHWVPTPEGRIIVSPSGRFVVRNDKAPADSLTMTAIVLFEAIGG